jgi:hypothetical protein
LCQQILNQGDTAQAGARPQMTPAAERSVTLHR